MPDKDGKTNAPVTAYEPAEEGDDGGKEQCPLAPPEPAPADPVGDAKRKLEQARNALADAEDTAKRDGEIEKAIAQYRGEQLRLEAEEEGAKAQLREGFEELKPTDREKAVVKQVWDGLKAEEKALKNSVATQGGELKEKREALEAVKKELADAKGDFESLKVLGKGVQAKLRDADTLRKEAFDAIARQKRPLAYYLLEYQLGKTIDGPPNPIEMADYIAAINLASKTSGEKSAAQRDLEANIKERETKLADDEKKLADLQKSFEATIRGKLGALA
jgi:DNA repair exonuclease SbcCD ATPase subunit